MQIGAFGRARENPCAAVRRQHGRGRPGSGCTVHKLRNLIIGAAMPICGTTNPRRSLQPSQRRISSATSLYLALFTLVMAAPGWAQLFERPLAVVNARILTVDGSVIEQGALLVKGGRIEAIGSDVKPPLLAKTVDAAGKTVTPGLIDPWSVLGLLSGGNETEATATAWDGFDGYQIDDFSEALRHGVTAVYLSAGSSPGIGGTGTVVRLVRDGVDGGPIGEPLAGSSAMGIDLGSERSPVARVRLYEEVRKQFRKALEYRESLEDYEEELKEYLEKLEERKKAEEKMAEPADGDDKDKKKTEEKKSNGSKKPAPEKNPEEKPKSLGEEPADDADSIELSIDSTAAQPRPRGPRPRPTDADNKTAEKKGEARKNDVKEKDELKKPIKPKPDRASESLLKAIDQKIPVRITAHRSEDILNALALAEEFNLELIIEGATEGYLVADLLAASEVKVVLGPVVRPGRYESNQFRRHTERNAAMLMRAGIPWAIGAGGETALASRFVAMNAQLAMAYASPDEVDSTGAVAPWLRLVTVRAAELLGVERRIGRLVRGALADFVIWNGDPGDPAARVEQVYVGGKLVYDGAANRAKEVAP